MHPRFELPPAADLSKEMPKRPPVCHYCGELGHKASFCQKLPPEQREAQMKADEAKYRQIALMKQQNPQYNHHLQQKLQGQLREQQENAGNDENQGPNQPINTNQPPPNFQNPGGFQHGPPGQFPGHHNMHQGPRPPFQPKRLEEVTCFKCGMKGHYANRCPKGHLAFLSAGHQQRFQLMQQQQQQQNPQE